MQRYTRATTSDELQQILRLQHVNLPFSISSEERNIEGFVTVQHDFELLRRMNDVCPHIIAKEGEKVMGYALCMHPQFGQEIEVLKPMFAQIYRVTSRLPASQNQLSNFMVMGQICIDKAYRKQGLFRGLYMTMLREIRPEFNVIITEVDVLNIRSLEAHYAIGFKTLSSYQADEREWKLIYLDGKQK